MASQSGHSTAGLTRYCPTADGKAPARMHVPDVEGLPVSGCRQDLGNTAYAVNIMVDDKGRQILWAWLQVGGDFFASFQTGLSLHCKPGKGSECPSIES